MEKFLKITVNGTIYDVKVEDAGPSEIVRSPAGSEDKVSSQPKEIEVKAPVEEPKAVTPGVGNIKVTAPMPGNIWKMNTSIGAKVGKHEVLLILEAMKMENEIVAPEAGTVTAIFVKEGDTVEPGKVLVELV